jgi:PKD repeat protein
VNGFRVHFIDQSKGAPTQWLWDFGDGSATSSAQNPTHRYPDGVYTSYTVKLIVTGPGGTDTATKSVTFQVPATPTPPPSDSPTPPPTEMPTPAPSIVVVPGSPGPKP